MVSRNTFRSRLLALAASTGLVAGLLGATGAQAAQYQMGELEIFFDTTISTGATLRTADREDSFLPWGNGGNPDTRTPSTRDICDITTFAPFATCDPTGTSFIFTGSPAVHATATTLAGKDNFDGSINSDDGRLNWDQGDFIGANVKAIHDVQARWRNWTFFTRFNYFYDAVLDDDSSAARSPLSQDARNDIGHGFTLLDLYLSVDFDVMDMPITLRHGRQVINWGESTFILNGINGFMPIDVNAFRRPGAELREGFLPIHATSIQFDLPLNVSVEAFYEWETEIYRLDPQGSPFSGSDVLRPGDPSGIGNLGNNSLIGGSPFSGTYRRNCDAAALGVGGVLNGINLAMAIATGGVHGSFVPAAGLTPGCGNPEIAYDYSIPIGTNEEVRQRNGDLNIVTRTGDIDANDGGEWGVAVRYYADWLNATEFGFYFSNYHSRLPIADVRPFGAPTIYTSTIGATTSALSRQVGFAGCGVNFLTGATLGLPSIGHFASAAVPLGGGFTYEMALASYTITPAMDPGGLMDAMADAAQAILLGAGVTTMQGATDTGGSPLPDDFTITFGGTELADQPNTMLKFMQINCALIAAQGGVPEDLSGDPAFPVGTPMLPTGAEVLGFAVGHQVRLLYPEDIRMWGASFNTTIGTWGVQGEISYRENQPLQLDTDALTIASALASCAFPASVGDASFGFEPLSTNFGDTGNCNPLAAKSNVTDYPAFVREEVITAQIGTTAIFTGSNPFVGFMGADLGILVTEAGLVYVQDARAEGDFSGPQLASNGCQGSDLPLGGLLALDDRSGCRPTEFSWGYVLFGRLDYNNVLGALTVSPQVAFSHNVEGYTPAPLGNYMEDRMSASMSVGVSYQNTWRGSIGYNTFFGAGLRNKARDRDFASVSLSYSF